MSSDPKWPEALGFSMAPFGYTVSVQRTKLTEDSVTYSCRREGCKFDVSLDPRDMNVEQAKQMMRWHVDQSH